MPSKYPNEVRRQVVDLARSGTRVSRLAARQHVWYAKLVSSASRGAITG